jgi:hypothetical protein
MAIIPVDEKVFMVSNSTNTTYSGSAALKAMNEWYTMQDVIDSVPTGFHMPLTQIVGAGLKYSVALTGTSLASVSYGPGAMVLSPFIPANNITVSNLSIQLAGGVASALAKILVYANVNGRPNGLLIESVDLDCSTSGTKTYNAAYTFNAGETYWIGAHISSTQTIRSVTSQDSISIGTSSTASTVFNGLLATYLYTDPVPTNPTLAAPGLVTIPMVMLQ